MVFSNNLFLGSNQLIFKGGWVILKNKFDYICGKKKRIQNEGGKYLFWQTKENPTTKIYIVLITIKVIVAHTITSKFNS